MVPALLVILVVIQLFRVFLCLGLGLFGGFIFWFASYLVKFRFVLSFCAWGGWLRS
jgi:hypothetical protein